MRNLVVLGVIALAALAGLYWLNASRFAPVPADPDPVILANGGLGQVYDLTGLAPDTCTASRTVLSGQRFLENTLPAFEAAFAAGADMVAADIQPTADGGFVVFGDADLACRTDGTGAPSEHGLAELQALDVGYGYTADGGASFPFRGTGIGAMPTLDALLAAFPERPLALRLAGANAEAADRFAAVLNALPAERRERVLVLAEDEAAPALEIALPDVTVTSAHDVTDCIGRYVSFGWAGFVSPACRDTVLLLPLDVARRLWGWPNRFLLRMHGVGTEVFVFAPQRDGDAAAGIDTEEDFARLPPAYDGGIWTERPDLVAALLSAD